MKIRPVCSTKRLIEFSREIVYHMVIYLYHPEHYKRKDRIL